MSRLKWEARADQAGAWRDARPGKRDALLDLAVERAWAKQTRRFRLIVRLIERTTDKKGHQHLLLPDVQLEGWWTSLDSVPAAVIQRNCEHATHEQYHDEFKIDLDLERLPSGKVMPGNPCPAPCGRCACKSAPGGFVDCNDLILQVAMLACNSLRWIGQRGLTGELRISSKITSRKHSLRKSPIIPTR